LKQQVLDIKNKISTNLKSAESQLEQFRKIETKRHNFVSDPNQTTEFLKEKKRLIGNYKHLSIDQDGVEKEMKKLNAVKRDVDAQWKTYLEKLDEYTQEYAKLSENVPMDVQNKIDQLESMKKSVYEKLADEKKKLTEELENRFQYNTIYAAVSDWLKTAEENVKTDYVGIDYEIVDRQLALQQVVIIKAFLINIIFLLQ